MLTMDQWKTTTKRFSPAWKTHPRSHRERALGMTVVVLCPECSHDINLHFFESNYPDFGFCQVAGCDCTCNLFNESND
jgi:hypothetical protein